MNNVFYRNGRTHYHFRQPTTDGSTSNARLVSTRRIGLDTDQGEMAIQCIVAGYEKRCGYNYRSKRRESFALRHSRRERNVWKAVVDVPCRV